MARHATFDDLPRPARILLNNEAEQLADRFGVEAALVQSGLLALAKGQDPNLVFDHEAFPTALRNFPFTLITDVLESLPRNEAVRIIREENLPQLASHVSLTDYLADEDVPFFSLAEMAEHVRTFAEFIVKHKKFIVATGLPPRYFRRCRWLYVQLGRLYDTRITGSPYPHDELFSGSKRKPEPQPYDWWRTSESGMVECSFEEAGIRHRIAPTDAERIEWNRQQLFNIKLRVLELLKDALDRRRAEDLLAKCVSEVTTALTSDQIEFYCRMDQLYLGASAIDGVDERPSAQNSPGGLANLLQVIGHVEAEIRIGMLSRTKEAMPPTLVQALREQAVQVDEIQLNNQDLCPWRYLRLMSRRDLDKLDSALDEMLKRAKWERAFWQDFQSRVRESLQPQTPVPMLIQLDPRCANLISPLVQDYADTLAKRRAEGETLVPPAPRGPVFRMVGDSWNIRYGEGALFAMEDAVGLHYIAHLLGHRGQRFPVEELRSIQTARMAGSSSRTKRGAVQLAIENLAQRRIHKLHFI
jgi:hypothetical protein